MSRGHDRRTSTGEGNTIAGNTSYGIYIQGQDPGSPSTSDVIENNTIGIDTAGNASANSDGIYLHYASGTTIYGNMIEHNTNDGIYDWESPGTTIGGTVAGMGNTISHNGKAGVYIYELAGVVVEGNTIDDNTTDGISVDVLSSGSATFANNTISGNTGKGIFVSGGSPSGILFAENVVETNGSDGIGVTDESNVTIGGTSTGAGNTIAGNTGDGIDIVEGGILIEDNTIGIDTAGNASPNYDGIALNTVSGANLRKHDRTQHERRH